MRPTFSCLSIGWCAGSHCGGVTAAGFQVRTIPSGLPGHVASLFRQPVKDFSRVDLATRRVLVAVEMAIRDTMPRAPDFAGDRVSLVGTSEHGVNASQREYFRDYVGFGRTMARSSLFLFTLPTTPLAAAAMHFQITGSAHYIETRPARLLTLAGILAGDIACGECDAAVAVHWDTEACVAAVICGGPPATSHGALADASDLLASESPSHLAATLSTIAASQRHAPRTE